MPKTAGASDAEAFSEGDSPRYHIAPRGLLGFYALLSIGRKPMSGYDLMKEVEEKTEGAWRPGPGAVYPVLKKLAKRGYISPRKNEGYGPAEVLYQITPAGRSNIDSAKKAMGSSGQRLRTMSSLFVDLMDTDDLVRFALNSFNVQAELIRTIVESERSKLGEEDKLYVLREYRLNLERELARTSRAILGIEGVVPSSKPGAEGRRRRARR